MVDQFHQSYIQKIFWALNCLSYRHLYYTSILLPCLFLFVTNLSKMFVIIHIIYFNYLMLLWKLNIYMGVCVNKEEGEKSKNQNSTFILSIQYARQTLNNSAPQSELTLYFVMYSFNICILYQHSFYFYWIFFWITILSFIYRNKQLESYKHFIICVYKD